MLLRIAALACLLLAALAPAAAAAGRAGTARALGAQMRWAGAAAGALAVDLDSGQTIYSLRAGARRMPASVQKLYTSVAALRRLGPGARLSTSVLAESAPDDAGIVEGDLYLRGSGDPTFDAFDSGSLAQQVADAGIVAVTGRVRGDESAFDGLRGVPSSGFRLTSDVGPLSALTFNRGRSGRRSPYWQPRPPRYAAAAFSRQLRGLGVDVRRRPATGVTPSGAALVTEWRSAPVAELVRLMNPPSDNFIAETLVKVLGARYGASGSTAAGAQVVTAELADLGIEPQVIDGSGLSRSDRTSPREVVTMLREMDGDASFAGSLPVAGRTGTLADRMRGTGAQDRCRAKTGTLRDVSALAGYCTARGGATIAFAFLMNYVSPYGARILQDRMARALTRYRR
ncbi:MAG TPA: D-alanyl-D-alanine carboxypeptidase/D-alanyl-D-alanine-endopeptidase [Solirubrobacteraceae bacterium]|nr:D-alanyl-D-alanine carboxypeptidase/D-alanyl-D-alanine-endopeptidase [Solirubrobacteraceae bacterium]